MLAAANKNDQFWSTLQQPVCCSKISTNTLRFLSALDNGWNVLVVQSKPSWDQTGFVYRVLMSDKTKHKIVEFILPRNNEIELIMERYDLFPCS